MLNAKMRSKLLVLVTAICICTLLFSNLQGLVARADDSDAISSRFFKIKVVDAETGRGVPLVELKTNNNIVYITDSAGYIAFYESGLMNKDVYFKVKSHGYTYKGENGGVVLRTVPGKEAVVEVDRENIAERLYRVTGQGIYRDSELLGIKAPVQNHVLNAKVMGQDSNHTIVYKDKVYWFWGDTSPTWHPLGNFRTTGAISQLPGNGGLDPDDGVDLLYFTRPDGFTKEMVPKVAGDPNLVWVSALMKTTDKEGNERMIAAYASLHGLGEEVASGVLAWNDNSGTFSERYEFDKSKRWMHPGGMAAKYVDDGKEYWIFAKPLPVYRVLNEFDAITDLDKYEAFTCLAPGTQFKGKDTELNRDENGNLVWEWRNDTPALTQHEEKELFELGLIKEDELRFQLKDIETGQDVIKHEGSIYWNEYRNMWSMITSQQWGTSYLGEIWYAEAPSPTGPWTYAKKIVTHDSYDFYNPKQHTMFDKDGGRILYFEGTYTSTFGGSVNTPRYEYNQIMYKLDLDDPRLEPLLSKMEEQFPDGGVGKPPAEKLPGAKDEDGKKDDKDAPKKGSYLGYVIGGVVVLALVAALGVLYLKRQGTGKGVSK